LGVNDARKLPDLETLAARIDRYPLAC
jgi:hypothetical protein